MLQADEPDDYVVATGETHSVREFLDAAFGHAGLDWHEYVKIDQRYFRPPRSTSCSATPRRRRRSSAGSRRSASTSSCA